MEYILYTCLEYPPIVEGTERRLQAGQGVQHVAVIARQRNPRNKGREVGDISRQ